jgi:hypothetical protein
MTIWYRTLECPPLRETLRPRGKRYATFTPQIINVVTEEITGGSFLKYKFFIHI